MQCLVSVAQWVFAGWRVRGWASCGWAGVWWAAGEPWISLDCG